MEGVVYDNGRSNLQLCLKIKKKQTYQLICGGLSSILSIFQIYYLLSFYLFDL